MGISGMEGQRPFENDSPERAAWKHRTQVQGELALRAFRKLHDVNPVVEKNFERAALGEWTEEDRSKDSFAREFELYFQETNPNEPGKLLHDISAVNVEDDEEMDALTNEILARVKPDTLH